MLFVTFALFVIRHPSDDTLFALVNEGERGWWLPGGGVDGHETFEQGARREAMEEAGVEVENAKLLRIELGYQRLRYVLTGTAKSTILKSVPDKESKGASWMTIGETKSISRGTHNIPNSRLRGPEPLEWFKYLARGGIAYDLDALVDCRVEPGTMGVDYSGRSVFGGKVSCVVACRVGDEFIVDPTCQEGVRLLSLEPNLASETMIDCAQRALQGLERLGLTNTVLHGVLRVRDHRNQKNEMDFRASFLATADHRASGLALKTAKPGEFLDPFDVETINRALANNVFPTSVIDSE